MLTDLKSVSRVLKSELGMCPIYHHKKDRCPRHLIITVLAYQPVQMIRRKLKPHRITDSWALASLSVAGSYSAANHTSISSGLT